ncbi:MAG: iron-sulfur cluster assembly accessory protein [Rhodospirillales bacterium]|nr:iron-sulfur cluster assembly accessory protein [Rhodospirillales bacterium]MCB9973100.1 iron-sulfur cluster assembly accessory protein [Rhodospirillales bacterium]
MPELLIDPTALDRLRHLRALRGDEALKLRITVQGGGCSGFQYRMSLDPAPASDEDLIYEDCVVTDSVSLPFLKGATILFEETLSGAEFKIKNPNAVSGCGCGSSFTV